MKSLKAIVFVSMSILLMSGPIFAEWEQVEKPQVSEVALKNMDRQEQNHKVEQISRSLTNLERKIDRLEDRLERLDDDLKELKRNFSSRSSSSNLF